MLIYCLLGKRLCNLSVLLIFDVVLILVTFPYVAYLDVLEMTAELTRVEKNKINYVGEN